MEHLPLPTQPLLQTIPIFPAIPYLCRFEYDQGPFLGYPERLGLPNLELDDTWRFPSLNIFHKRFLAEMSPAELKPLLQNWLFFGLLHELLEDKYHHEDFIALSTHDGVEKKTVTTATLLTRLQEREVQIKQDVTSIPALYKHLARCLNLTHACLEVEFPDFDNDLKFHLASVAELLGYAVSKACNVAWTDDPGLSLHPVEWGTSTRKQFQKSLLLDRSGCCPSKIKMLIEDFGSSPQAFSFAAVCAYVDRAPSNHTSCDEKICRLTSSATSPKVPHHASESCKCQLLQVDEKLLADCLEKGCLPLLRIRETNIDEIMVEVVASKDDSCYVALSHVWADGLGNPKATALPRCQLSRVKALVENLDFDYLPETAGSGRPGNKSEILLWCDTLCCPVQDKSAKNMALLQMYCTYERASVVLVLDQGLISHHQGRASVIQACIRVATSRWMTRLWTLQEGALPAKKNRLWFQFTKTALPLWSLYQHLFELSANDIQWRGIISSIIRRLNTFTHLFNIASTKSQGASFKDVSRGLLYRSVTVPSDEPLIIATLMGLDLSRILACKPRKRILVLWRMITTSPLGVDKGILFHTAPTLKRRGLRWAPRSLLFTHMSFARPAPCEPDNRASLAKVGNTKGLVAELAGIRISVAESPNYLPKVIAGFDSLPIFHDDRYRLLLKDGQGRWYLLVPRGNRTSALPSDLEELYACVSKLNEPWVLYRGSHSDIPGRGGAHHAFLSKAKSESQTQSNEPLCVNTKLQVDFGHVSSEINRICQAAYSLAQDLASTAAAQAVREFAATDIDQETPVYWEALQNLDREIELLSKGPTAVHVLTTCGIGANELGFKRMDDYITRMYRGLYLHVEQYAPGNTKWCVD